MALRRGDVNRPLPDSHTPDRPGPSPLGQSIAADGPMRLSLLSVAETSTLIVKTRIPPRKPFGIYRANRACKGCGALLRTDDPGPTCDPCWLKSLPQEERVAA